MVFCRDTDILLLLLHFFGGADHIVWMIGGTARERRCYPVHTIYKNLPQDVLNNILGFHALTGSDITSSFPEFGKRSCWKMFIQHPLLLDRVGRDGPFEPVEEFICYLYMALDVKGGVDKARADIVRKGKKELNHLPPTSDALQLHALRANYQSKLWLHADKQCIKLFAGSPESSGGWLSMGIRLAVAWSTLPAVPKVCLELVACGCLTKCKSSACKCSNTHQICTLACGCMPKIVVIRHHELSSIIIDQIVLVTFISQYYSNNLVHRL